MAIISWVKCLDFEMTPCITATLAKLVIRCIENVSHTSEQASLQH